MKNRYKIMLMAEELHKRGYGKMRVVPYLSPSGVYWRCNFVDKSTKYEFTVTEWIFDIEKGSLNGEIIITPKELADIFIREDGGVY